MIEIKNFGGKLNKDDSFYAIPQGDYADALNITHDAIEGSNDLVITNVVSNREIENPYNVEVYNGEPFNFIAGVVDNNDNTQDVRIKFDNLFLPKYFISLLTNGDINNDFYYTENGFNYWTNKIEIQNDNKILVGGYFDSYENKTSKKIVRLNQDGTIDLTFDTGNIFDYSLFVNAIKIQSDGKILVGGNFNDPNNLFGKYLIRLNSNGTKDSLFDSGITPPNNTVNSIELQSDGKILVGGAFTSFNSINFNRIFRLNSNGTIDNTFSIGTGFNGNVYIIKKQSDGKILVGGTFTSYDGFSSSKIIRLNVDGSVDTSFLIGSGFNDDVLDISIQSDGKILVGGVFTSYNGNSYSKIIRLNSDGSIDNTFNIGSGFNIGGYISSIKIDSNNDFFIGGSFTSYDGNNFNNIIKLNNNGSINNSLVIGNGFNNAVSDIEILNNKLLVAGLFDSYKAPLSLNIYYYDNGWINYPGIGITSPQVLTLPIGDYSYKAEIQPYNITVYLEKSSKPNITIGAYPNTIRNKIIFFNFNKADFHSILEYDNTTREVNKIFLNLIDSDTDVLGFTENGKISSINIFNRDEGDLLFFIDSLYRPTFIDIDKMKANVYNPVIRDYIDVAKNQPLIPPSGSYGDEPTLKNNYLINRFFRFKYRYVYDENFKSTCSPISKVSIPVDIINDEVYSNQKKNNKITLSIFSGDKTIKAIELLMSYAEKSNIWSDFQIVETINKSQNSISNNSFFNYVFYNNSTYPVLDINESNLLFDYVPDKANCQELLNGNVLGYGGITEGYNKEQVNFDVLFNNFISIPNLINPFSPYNILNYNSIPVWKWSTERNIGVVYYDKKGKTNGVIYNQKISLPPYKVNPFTPGYYELPSISVSIYSKPPIWAHSFQFLYTKENTQYLYWVTNSVNTSEADFIYLEVTGLINNAKKLPNTAQVLSYSFKDGDRLRLISSLNNQLDCSSYFSEDYDAAILGLLDAPTINGIPQGGKQFLKIKKTAPFQNSTFAGQNQWIIEIYTPNQPSPNEKNQVYYESGEQFNVLNPGTQNRLHSGNVQNQTQFLPAASTLNSGDAYLRVRTISIDGNNLIKFVVVDRNIVDTLISAVNSFDGRPNLIDINAKEQYYPSTIRHGQAYQPNTNINGLNRFYPEDFLDVDYSYGSIQRLKTRDRLVRVFQELKIGSIPLFSKIGKSPTGDEVVISTNSLLNPVQYYVGDWGIGTCPESLASFNFADYFCDNKRGAICRVSNDGVTPLSILYKMNSWANNELPLRKGNYKIYGAFEQRQNNYVIALEATNTSEAYTLSFDEERNSFDSFLSYKPEMMCPLGVLFVTFKNGVPWTHDDEPYYNNFYGVQYDSRIKGVFNKDSFMKKTYISISEMASQVWYCPSIETSSKSYGNTKQSSNLIESDFSNFEDNFYASLLRDANSIGGINNGDYLKGNWISILFEAKSSNYPLNNLISLGAVSLKYNDSPLNNR